MKQFFISVTTALGLAALAMHAHAGQASSEMHGMNMEHATGKSTSNALAMSEGKVKAIDKASKTITLQHGPIKSKTLDMGPMTMSFPVQDAALLTKVKVGDKVSFTAENVNNAATVTSLIVQR